MDTVNIYFNKNDKKIKQIFKNQSKDNQIPATKLFNLLQMIFQVEEITFQKNEKSYFHDDQNNNHMQNVIEKYYKSTKDGASKKFYLYRVNFTYQDILEYLAYWLNNDKIGVNYPALSREIEEKKNQEKTKLQSPENNNNQKEINVEQLMKSKIFDNQFTGDEQKKTIYIQTYQKEIQKLQSILINTTIVPQKAQEISQKINLYKQKINQLQKIKIVDNNTDQIQMANNKNNKLSPKKYVTEVSKNKKEVTIKSIFQFYAKQNHLTGLKASFQRIEHQSQTVNYQKLVHFLKQYDLFPQKASLQKKIHNIYVRVCSNTRDLFYPQFLQFLQKFAQVIIQLPPGSLLTKNQIITERILSKSQKTKVLHNPFHSLQKNDFRINSHQIKYQFKLKPIKGKIQQQVINQLQNRKKLKQQEKVDSNKDKQQRIIKKLKKLMAIDPYHPQVIKNAQLLHQRQSMLIQSVANLDNMQKFRDNKFDMKAQFGISHFDQDPLREVSHRYDMAKVEMLQKLQSERMNNIMSSLIGRQQAKIEKFSNLPRKRHASSKLY